MIWFYPIKFLIKYIFLIFIFNHLFIRKNTFWYKKYTKNNWKQNNIIQILSFEFLLDAPRELYLEFLGLVSYWGPNKDWFWGISGARKDLTPSSTFLFSVSENLLFEELLSLVFDLFANILSEVLWKGLSELLADL
jgi:hypothetical protein